MTMKNKTDHFRPHTQPAQRIYDAFRDEATKRKKSHDWEHQERLRVFREARDYAQENGLSFPTLDQVRICESYALGHTDYGSQWAYKVAELIG